MMTILRTFRELTVPRTPATPAAGKRRLAVLLLLAVGIIMPSVVAAQVSLPVVVADFNHDGVPDSLVLSATSPTATLAFGAVPYGTFSPSAKLVTFPSGCTSLPQGSVVVGDFNNDGFPDILFLCASATGVMLGNGDGTFGAAQLLDAIGTAAVLGDFNKDGKLDIVVFETAYGNSGYAETLEFFAGNGDGTFASSVVTTLPAIAYTGPVAADVNADGYPDIVLLYLSDGGPPTLQVFGNNKDGTFGIAANGYTSPNVYADLGYDEPESILTGNFFGTGATDLVAATDAGLVVIQNTSTATTYSLGTPTTIPYYGLTNALAGNFTGSGFTDIVVANGISIAVLANSADGNANFTASYSTLTLPTTNVLFSVADANGDGYSDIYTAVQPQTGSLQLGVNITTGTATATAQPVSLGPGAQAISATWPGNVNFTGSNATGTQQVNAAAVAPTLTWPAPAPITYGTPLSATQLDAVATGTGGPAVPGTYVYTPTFGTILGVGTQALNVVFTPTDTADYTVATATQTLTVLQTTTTTLALTSGGAAVTTVASGSVVTLMAAVTAGGNSVAPGQVAFCDATAATCSDNHLLATVELVAGDSTSTATYKFVPGIGNHSYKAVFLGTTADAGSASAAAALAVTGKYATTTALASSGVQASYALTATLDGFGQGSPSGSVAFKDTSTNGTLGTMPITGVMRSFVAGAAIAGVSAPKQVVTADINGDGKPDLVVANQSGAMVTVLIGNGDGTYTALPSFGTNYNGITGVAVADFNGDGKLDIATANQSTVGIFLGNGDGTFGAEQDFANTNTSAGVFAGDFNGDGKVDLAVPDRYNGMTILIGNGDGTFTQPNPAFAAGTSPNYQSAVADFNGDGKLDIATGNYYDNTVSILLGNGDGTLQAPVTYATGAAPYATFAGDFNGDGIPDIFLTNFNDGTISVLLGNGDGTFQAQQTYTVGTNPTGASVGDLNGDGKLDIAVANQNDGTVSILYGNGDGTFQAQQVLTSGNGANFVAIADVNEDGSPDLAAVNLSSNTVTVFLNQAIAAVSLTGVTLPGTGMDSVVATYSGDTVFAGSTSNTLTLPSNPVVTMTTPIITWATPAAITYGTPLSATQLDAVATGVGGAAITGTYVYTPAAGTILGLGTQALSVVFTPTDTLDYTVATATQSLTVLQAVPTTTLALTSGGAAVTTIASGSVLTLTASVGAPGIPVTTGQVNFCNAAATSCTDINLLGTAQLTSAGTATLRFVPGIGAHSYKAVFLGTKNDVGSASAAATLTVTGTYPTTTTIAQSGAAGNYTLTATTTSTNGANVAPTGTVSFLDTSNAIAVLGTGVLGAGTTALGFATPAAPSVSSVSVVGFPILADFNGDGKMDMAITSAATDTSGSTLLNIFLGNGDGTFSAGTTITIPSSFYITAADLNHDGKIDLILSGNDYTNGHTVFVLLGNGDGTFAAGTNYEAGTYPTYTTVADFNGDGIPDIAVSNQPSVPSNIMTILLGNGDGTFRQGGTVVAGTNPYATAAGDFNGDGKVDLAVTNPQGNTLTILLGNGDGTFTQGVSPPVGNNPDGIVAGDFNGDGKLDLAVTNADDSTLTVLLGNGDGTFNVNQTLSIGMHPQQVAIGDFNRDGKADVAITSADGNAVDILLGTGLGTFTPTATPATVTLPFFLATGDLNGDGITDVVSSNAETTVNGVQTNALTVLVTQLTQTATATATGVSPIGTGPHQVVASYGGDVNYGASVSQPTGLTGIQLAPVLTWVPAVSSIVYGTPLGAQQLNAVATTPAGAQLAGVLTYTPAAGTLLDAGAQTLQVLFTPADAVDYLPATASVTITVTPAKPVITWATPASIPYGVPLSATQLDATVAGVTGAALPGTLTYNPAAGAVLNPGTQTLTVSFAPTNALDYTTATGSVQLTVAGVTVASAMPSTATLGDPATSITLSGSGFVATSVVQVNGTAIPTTFVNATTLTAVIPASYFATVGTLQITVSDPTVSLTSPAFTFTVVAPAVSATVSAPSTTNPGSQPVITFTIDKPYPIDLNVTLTLSFAASTTPAIDDPNVQFSAGGRTLTFVVPANSTTVPAIQLQSGTVAGTITIPFTLTAAGINVTPTTLVPVVITVPPAAPTITGMTLSRSGNQLTAVIHGFSNTRQMNTATFHFTASSTATAPLSTTDLTVPADTIFTTWYSSTPSDQYGSSFTYTQVFTVSDLATDIGTVEATLTNSVGASNSTSAQ